MLACPPMIGYSFTKKKAARRGPPKERDFLAIISPQARGGGCGGCDVQGKGGPLAA
jgi:hypothetical protein